MKPVLIYTIAGAALLCCAAKVYVPPTSGPTSILTIHNDNAWRGHFTIYADSEKCSNPQFLRADDSLIPAGKAVRLVVQRGVPFTFELMTTLNLGDDKGSFKYCSAFYTIVPDADEYSFHAMSHPDQEQACGAVLATVDAIGAETPLPPEALIPRIKKERPWSSKTPWCETRLSELQKAR
jgi:hypothetical protein